MQATTTELKKFTATITVNVEVYVDKNEKRDWVEQMIVDAIHNGQREVTQHGVEEVWFDFSKCFIKFHN
jgi:hypothetical protein